MEDYLKARNIMLSSLDCARLRDLVITAKTFASTPSSLVACLEAELDRAKIVSPSEIPPYVVTMNTCARLVDVATGERMEYTLVFPSEADPEHGRLSILTDLGVAILGFSVGDTIEWTFPTGVRRIKIEMICYQPEATKRYDL